MAGYETRTWQKKGGQVCDMVRESEFGIFFSVETGGCSQTQFSDDYIVLTYQMQLGPATLFLNNMIVKWKIMYCTDLWCQFRLWLLSWWCQVTRPCDFLSAFPLTFLIGSWLWRLEGMIMWSWDAVTIVNRCQLPSTWIAFRWLQGHSNRYNLKEWSQVSFFQHCYNFEQWLGKQGLPVMT